MGAGNGEMETDGGAKRCLRYKCEWTSVANKNRRCRSIGHCPVHFCLATSGFTVSYELRLTSGASNGTNIATYIR